MARPLIRRSTTTLACLILLIGAHLHATKPAHAAKGVVVRSFSGPQGAAAARDVRAEVGRFARIVSASRYRRAKAQGDSTSAARKLGVAAIISGKIVRDAGAWTLKIVVRRAIDGSRAGRSSFPLSGIRVDRGTARHAARAIRRVLARIAAPAGARRRAKKPADDRDDRPRRRRRRRSKRPAQPKIPKPAKSGFDDGSDLDEEEEEEAPAIPRHRRRRFGEPPPSAPQPSPRGNRRNDNAQPRTARRAEPPRPRTPRKPRTWRTLFVLSAGLPLLHRAFSINDPRTPSNPAPYKTPSVVPGIALAGSFFPLELLGDGWYRDIGITGAFQRVIGVTSNIIEPGQPTIKGTTEAFYFDLDLTYRWNFFDTNTSPILSPRVGFGQQIFNVLDQVSLPNLQYTYVRVGTDFEMPIYHSGDIRFAATIGLGYLITLSAGDIELEVPPGYGSSSTGGIDTKFGAYISWRGIFMHLDGFYRRYFFTFAGDCGNAGTCNLAGGALDEYAGVNILFGYRY